jgi:2-amino-4-hydroxy-6-hydroxymethyldihydropteridine diphosphokinase
MERVDVYFGLGSNMGDREDNLAAAVAMMADAFGALPQKASSIIETPSWGFEGPDFLNQCVMFRLPRKGSPAEHALSILAEVKRIEKALGRAEEPPIGPNQTREYHDRPIDIDILFYGNYTIDEPSLKIPHPLIPERDFVKIPLKEIGKQI